MKPTYTLRWFERFGNNIQQISNGIMFAKSNNYCFISPEHELINSFKININEETNNLVYNKFFNCWNFKSCHLWNEYNLHRHRIIKDIIYHHLKFKNNITEKLPLDNLVVHIRSGDIFRKTHKPCHKFVQNPLCFFEKIISQYNQIYICSEDDRNPVINYLSKLPNTTIYTNRNIIDDIILLMRSQNICIGGVGTFAVAISMLSQNLRNFYATDLDPKTFLNYNMINPEFINKHITHIDEDKYIKIGKWKNTRQQKELMINYKL